MLLKAALADDLGSAKILELGRVGPRLGTEPDQQLGAFQIAVVVRRNIRDKICRMFGAHGFFPQSQVVIPEFQSGGS